MKTQSFGATVLLLAFVIGSCGTPPPPPDPVPPSETPPTLPTAEEVRADLTGLSFDEFLARSFRHVLRRSPESVLDLGLEGEIDIGKSFIDDVSDAFLAETRALDIVLLERLQTYDRAALSARQQTSYDIYEWWLDDRIRDHAFEVHHYRVSPMLTSVHMNTELVFTDVLPIRNADEARQYVNRLWRVANKFAQTEATIRRQQEAGVVLPKYLNGATQNSLNLRATQTAILTPYYTTLATKTEGIVDEEVRAQLLSEAEFVIRTLVKPAYASMKALLESQHATAPTALGVGTQPKGQAFYAHTLRHHITTAMTADEVHQLGLDQLELIHAELRSRFKALGYPDTMTIEEGLTRAKNQSGSVASSQIVSTYEQIIAEAQTKLPEAFDLLPSAAVKVKGVPSGGFYVSASLDGSRPGTFFATVATNEPRFGMRTLAYHEAVPGHHLQIGIAQDLPLPLFQRVIVFTGFAEGWALYAERLAAELNWYADDPYADIGRLQAEAFRAARLVVDTGLHAKGWGMHQALDFLMHNAGLSSGAALGQVSRYASWPGQATAYMTGSLKIQALKERAQAAKGGAFDLKAFHRAVLSRGSLPIDIMNRVVAEDLQLP